ncbi:MAG: VanZ family protein [Methylococcaceae bacterium]
MTQSNNFKPVFFICLLIIGWIIATLIESSGPPLPLLGEAPHLDKVAHFIAFSGLGLLACALAFKLNPTPTIPLLSAPLLMVTLFGIIDEAFQMLVPGRQADLLDLLADICGALFAVFSANLIARLLRANKPVKEPA